MLIPSFPIRSDWFDLLSDRKKTEEHEKAKKESDRVLGQGLNMS